MTLEHFKMFNANYNSDTIEKEDDEEVFGDKEYWDKGYFSRFLSRLAMY